MILIGLATVLLGQAHVLGAQWTGDWLPDPFVVLVALAALHGQSRGLVPWAVGLGWGRALVQLEPVGLQVREELAVDDLAQVVDLAAQDRIAGLDLPADPPIHLEDGRLVTVEVRCDPLDVGVLLRLGLPGVFDPA